MCGNCSINQRPENSGNFVERDLKLIRSRETHNELAHQIWAQSHQQFVRKCMETARPNRCQEKARMQWSAIKSLSVRGRAEMYMYWPNLRSIPWAVCLEMRRNHKVRDGQPSNQMKNHIPIVLSTPLARHKTYINCTSCTRHDSCHYTSTLVHGCTLHVQPDLGNMGKYWMPKYCSTNGSHFWNTDRKKSTKSLTYIINHLKWFLHCSILESLIHWQAHVSCRGRCHLCLVNHFSRDSKIFLIFIEITSDIFQMSHDVTNQNISSNFCVST